MGIKIVPKDKQFIIPIVVILFFLEGFILTTKPGLGGFIFLGCIFYFGLFVIFDIMAKEKETRKRIKFRPKNRMCTDY